MQMLNTIQGRSTRKNALHVSLLLSQNVLSHNLA
jgi:hypothetical protein